MGLLLEALIVSEIFPFTLLMLWFFTEEPEKREAIVPQVSKYAEKLRALGCTPYSEILSPEDMNELDELAHAVTGRPVLRLSRKDRRICLAKKILPGFTTTFDSLYVIDETGTDWQGPVDLDLEKELGFCDLRAKAYENLFKRFVH
jgi:hypothetical protein